ncbi:4'-phosphopantetheinyl transferase family protein [Sphingobacterium paludis]|uniref:4'-phosphopantetheinyl transferase n=1 Tax=Sphingobacterium paludis TaxID=1476465 RepID=A0A4R7D4S0_9SPHI|nr:4'-phosphopantetheinyl transferase superfamily protein [Sphingobacterium paludis]TDS13866.1 4'-phosphopantetheinyl transferase [Sphingobacterium paludis]
MLTLYYSKLDLKTRDEDFMSNLLVLPLAIQQRILKLKSIEEQCSSLTGYLLLRNGLKEQALRPSLDTLKYTEYGKPYFDEDIQFNISHSHNHVVCAFSTQGKVGVDIERIRPIDYRNFKKVFREDEWSRIKSSADPVQTFFHIWTAKESILKADGRGLNAPLRNIFIGIDHCKLEGALWYCRTIPLFESFIVQIATETNADEITIREMNIAQFMT